MLLVPADALGRAVLATFAWFDGFGWPLSAEEAWRWLVAHAGEPNAFPQQVAECIAGLVAEGQLVREGDRHALAGSAAHFATRRAREPHAARKLRRARRFAKCAALLPFVTLVAAANSLGYGNADDESDIDLFVVTTPGTAWMTRGILAGALWALRLRPAPGRTRDALCLSFIVDEANLGMGRFALADGDPYLAWWCAALLPLVDKGVVATRFASANGWVVERIPEAFSAPHWARGLAVRRVGPVARSVAALVRHLEPAARRLQERAFGAGIRALVNADTRVVAEAGVLKFHVNDRREEFRARYEAKLSELGLRQEVASVRQDYVHAG
jgi:hypothetical protein